MKRTLIKALMLCFLFQNIAYCAPNQSTNSFPVDIQASDIPAPISNSGGGGGGLSGGAVSAIALGSIGGAVLLGGLAWFLKPYWSKGMTSGSAVGLDNPVIAMCLDEKTVENIINKYQNSPLLIKALREQDIKECPDSKYVLIPDTAISDNTFNTVVIKIPQEMKNAKGIINVKMIQASNPLSSANLDSELFLGTDANTQNNMNKKSQVPFKTIKSDRQNGIIIKNGQIDIADLNTDSTGFLIISYKDNIVIKSNSTVQKYAYAIEFSR